MSNENDSITMNDIYAEIIRNRTELKNLFEASEARILLELETLKTKAKNLETENEHLRTRVEFLEREAKKKNIIIFGVQKTAASLSIPEVCGQLNELLEIDIRPSEISNVYTVGKSTNCPIKVEFISQATKALVLKSCSKLKGTNISISQDLTRQQQQENKILRKHLNRVRENNSNKCYIKGNKLYIDNKSFSVEELEEGVNNSQLKFNSAPPTPNLRDTVYEIEDSQEVPKSTVTSKATSSVKPGKKQKIAGTENRITRQRIHSSNSSTSRK